MKSRSILHWWRHVEGDQRIASVQAGERERGGWEWEMSMKWDDDDERWHVLEKNLLEFTVKEKWKYKIKKETKRNKKKKENI